MGNVENNNLDLNGTTILSQVPNSQYMNETETTVIGGIPMDEASSPVMQRD